MHNEWAKMPAAILLLPLGKQSLPISFCFKDTSIATRAEDTTVELPITVPV
jgi:hypothetical protein